MDVWKSLLAVLTLAACDGTMADLEDARGKWREAAITSYAFDLHETGFLPPQPPTHITVQNGRVTGVAAIPPNPVAGWSLSQAPTIETLFDKIEDKLRGDANVTATWDQTLGFPVSAYFDLGFENTGFQVLAFQAAR